jgi:hypothetical protein
MKHLYTALVATLFAEIGWASSMTVPGFTAVTPSIEGSNAHLLVKFNEEGLSPGNVTLRVTAKAEVKYGQANVVEGTITTTREFVVGSSGSISSEIELTAPLLSNNQPNEITFSNIGIEDLTNGVPAEADSEVSKMLSVNHLPVAKKHHPKRKHRRARTGSKSRHN